MRRKDGAPLEARMSSLRVSAEGRKGIIGDERIFLETSGAVLTAILHDMEA